MMRRLFPALLCLATLLPVEASAHVADGAILMLLPTQYYLVGGTLAVSATFVLMAFGSGEWLHRLLRARADMALPLPRIEGTASLASTLFFLALVTLGLIGPRDPLANPLPLTIWTLLWIAVPVLCAILGNLWPAINPWTGLAALLKLDRPLVPLPARLGSLPALIALLGFGWFELVDLAPDDPERLAFAAGLYWLWTMAMIAIFGVDEWMKRGEFLSVLLGYVGALAPLQMKRHGPRVRAVLAVPGGRLTDRPAPPVGDAVFILSALAIVSFDGLCRTFWWLSLHGINPLAFPGRSAMTQVNTIGLLGACALLTLAFFVALRLGERMAGEQAGPGALRLVLSVVPIALAYQFAHYLTVFLVNGQYALAALNDPLARGDALFGIDAFYVTTSFLNRPDTVETIWQVQSGAIVLGHLLAVGVAHRVALDLHSTPRRALLGGVPLAALMIAYTLFGLWLLASPTGA